VNGSGSLLRVMSDDAAAPWWALYRRGILVSTNGLLALSTAMSPRQLEAVEDRIRATLHEEPGLVTRRSRQEEVPP
jgi:glutamate-1-semialdehyde 2,1-aminomutase